MPTVDVGRRKLVSTMKFITDNWSSWILWTILAVFTLNGVQGKNKPDILLFSHIGENILAYIFWIKKDIKIHSRFF